MNYGAQQNITISGSNRNFEHKISGLKKGDKVTLPSYDQSVDKPQIDSSIPVRNDKMFLQLNNKTNGKYKDDQIYWIVIGRNKNHEICYLDAQGNLIKASEALNTITKNGRKCANIAHSMAEAKYVYLPDIESGRMYLSYGEPVYMTRQLGTSEQGTKSSRLGRNRYLRFGRAFMMERELWLHVRHHLMKVKQMVIILTTI